MISRRQALMSALFGTGYVGLRALATGLPASFLLNPRRALAAGAPSCAAADKAQFFILSTSADGDPLNANVPGSYVDPGIVHSADPAMAATPLSVAGQKWTAARPWAQLPQAQLDRIGFWHIMTNAPIHPRQPDVLKLMGAASGNEMLPSLLAAQMAPCLGTIQTQPVSVGARRPLEGISYGGAPLPIMPPLALRATLTSPDGPLGNLQALRDQTLDDLGDLFRDGASSTQRKYLDDFVLSQRQARNLSQDLLATLGSIGDNSVASQIQAAVVLIQMKVAPVVAIHIPFGGDNHNDQDLSTESNQTVTGVAAIGSLMDALAAAGLQDRVSFLSLNVFGRTIGPGTSDGRQHNANHHVALTIGKPFRGGVFGGVAFDGADYSATAIDSKSGSGRAGGDVAPIDTLASFGKTTLAAVGGNPNVIASGRVITGGLV